MGKQHLYVLLMLITGVIVGVVVAGRPELDQGSLPPFSWILFVSLAIDLVIMRLPGSQGIATLPMPWRVAGFICAVLLYILVSRFLPLIG